MGGREYNAGVILIICGQVNPYGHGKCICLAKTIFCEYFSFWHNFEENGENQDNLHKILHKKNQLTNYISYKDILIYMPLKTKNQEPAMASPPESLTKSFNDFYYIFLKGYIHIIKF